MSDSSSSIACDSRHERGWSLIQIDDLFCTLRWVRLSCLYSLTFCLLTVCAVTFTKIRCAHDTTACLRPRFGGALVSQRCVSVADAVSAQAGRKVKLCEPGSVQQEKFVRYTVIASCKIHRSLGVHLLQRPCWSFHAGYVHWTVPFQRSEGASSRACRCSIPLPHSRQ